MTTDVDQSSSHAGRDIIGGDLNNNLNIYENPRAASIVEQLMAKLHKEMEGDQKIKSTVERLQRYYAQRSHDGIEGLEAKLTKAGRADSYLDAIEMKEMFVKLLEQWSLYDSAQRIFAHLLARAERQFNDIILPQISDLKPTDTNLLVHKLIIAPTVDECGASVFDIDQNVAMGMVYWLAEQCFVRWHK